MNFAPRVGDWTAGGSGPVSHPYFRREHKSPILSAGFRPRLPRTARGSNPAARRGLRFEAKVLERFQRLYGRRFISQLSFFFENEMTPDGRPGTRGEAVPDGLLFSPDYKQVLLLEVKLRHSGDAWWQTNKFYKPILEKAFFGLIEVTPVEVVQHYDPRVRLPVPQAVLLSLDEAFSVRPCFHPVLIRDKNGA